MSNQKNIQRNLQRKLLVLFSALLLTGFLLFIPQGTYATDPVFTAGYYQDHGTTNATSCEAGYWQAYVELKDFEGNALVADTLRIRAIHYPDPGEEELGIGYEIYDSEDLNNLDSFETPCEIEIKEGGGRMVLEVEASKDGYYAIKATNNTRHSGGGLSQQKWSKTLYLALTNIDRWEDANIAYLFPENDQWISAAEEYAEMKLFVNKAPLPDNITGINIEIKHTGGSGATVSRNVTTNIAEGEVVFPRPALTGQGEYTWRVTAMRSTPSIFYNEKMSSRFKFDSIPPILEYGNGRRVKLTGTLEQAPHVAVHFRDFYSGMDKIKIYLDDGEGGELGLVKTCSSSDWPRPDSMWCIYTGGFKEYSTSTTYNYYFIGYDYLGNQTEFPPARFTINPLKPARLHIWSNVYNTAVTGTPFEITEVVPDDPEGPAVPAAGTYETYYKFETYQDYDISLEAPDSYDGADFSFWRYGITAYNSRTIDWHINVPYSWTFTMWFGVSRLHIQSRIFWNTGTMSDDLINYIKRIPTRIEQIEGTPENLLGPDGYHDFTRHYYYATTVVAVEGIDIDNIVLRALDSEDGILKFAGFQVDCDNCFCEPDPEDPRQCQGSINGSDGRLRHFYRIQRAVEVKTYLGGEAAEGVNITGSGEMEGGETPYTIFSTAKPGNFTGTLSAPESIIDTDGNEAIFGGWEGCRADGLTCHIEATTMWYNTVATTVIAHYAGSAESPTPELTVNITGNGTVTSTPAGINCVGPNTCADYFDLDSSVILTADPAPNSDFVGWTAGDCMPFGANETCTLFMDLDKQTQAEFAPITYDLTIYSTAGGSVTTPSEETSTHDAGKVVDLVASADSGYQFTNWTGDVSTVADVNDPSTTITMDDNYSITAHFEEVLGPTAAMECDIAPGACLGPGCVCSNILPLPTWETFRNGDIQYHVINMSTAIAPAVVTSSAWSIEDSSGSSVWGHTCISCNMTIQPSIVTSTYDIVLEVEDSDGLTASTSHEIEIKQDIDAVFKCSLDDINWESCADIAPLSDQVVYFQDNSTPSKGAIIGITSWVWKKGDGGTFEEFASGFYTASTTLTTATNTVHLTVWDDHPTDGVYPEGRSAEVEHPLDVALPLPEYREVAPVGRLDNFLARLVNVFVRF